MLKYMRGDFMDDFGLRLKAIRKAKRISQSELSEKSQISQTNISKLERGASSPTIYTAQQLANALGVKLSDLMGPPPQVYETVLTERERELISCFRRLSAQEQGFIYDSVIHAAEKYDLKFDQGDQLHGVSGA